MPINETNLAEIMEIANRSDLKETGGAHNQKGVDFQRHWALMRIFQLEDSHPEDFLFLFEVIQDVAEFDSSVSPSSVTLYQVKKKDRNEWEWQGLTNLPSPKTKKGKPLSPEDLSKTMVSPIGKLYATVIAFASLESHGRFISNAGCNLPLLDGGNAATSVPCSLNSLDPAFHALLKDGLQTLHKTGMPIPDLDRIWVERVALHPDNLAHTLIGQVAEFLQKRSPRHTGQAKSLVDSLMATIGPLGAKTDKCLTFHEVKKRHGFTRKELIGALGQLESIPDVIEYLDMWIGKLSIEGMAFTDLTAIKASASAYYTRQVLGGHTEQERLLVLACDEWLLQNNQIGSLRKFFEEAYLSLGPNHPGLRKHQVLAIFALRAIAKCVDPT